MQMEEIEDIYRVKDMYALPDHLKFQVVMKDQTIFPPKIFDDREEWLTRDQVDAEIFIKVCNFVLFNLTKK